MSLVLWFGRQRERPWVAQPPHTFQEGPVPRPADATWDGLVVYNGVPFLLTDSSHCKVLCLWEQGVNIDFNQ